MGVALQQCCWWRALNLKIIEASQADKSSQASQQAKAALHSLRTFWLAVILASWWQKQNHSVLFIFHFFPTPAILAHQHKKHQYNSNNNENSRHCEYYLKLCLLLILYYQIHPHSYLPCLLSLPLHLCRRCFDTGAGLHGTRIDTVRDVGGRAGGWHGYNGDSCGRI